MKKNLGYFMGLNYPVEITQLTEEEGGGYSVSIPMLGRFAYVGYGETLEDALADLTSVKEVLFKEALAKDALIPEPVQEKHGYVSCSGKFLFRPGRQLHYYLKCEAERNNLSLNQYCIYQLTRRDVMSHVIDALAENLRQSMVINEGVKAMPLVLSRTLWDVPRSSHVPPEPRNAAAKIPHTRAA